MAAGIESPLQGTKNVEIPGTPAKTATKIRVDEWRCRTAPKKVLTVHYTLLQADGTPAYQHAVEVTEEELAAIGTYVDAQAATIATRLAAKLGLTIV